MLISDGFGTYTLGPNGEKRYATATKLEMNGELVYRFNPATGILEVSMSEADALTFTKLIGGLPAKEIVLPSPPPLSERCYFHNVKEIRSLPKKDGSFFITISSSEEKTGGGYESLEVYGGSKSRCDNCSREFANGEVVSVDQNQELVFCYSDAGGGCGPAYTFSSGKMVVGVPMKFGTENLPPQERTPCYPDSPVFEKAVEGIVAGEKRKGFWATLFGS